MSREAMKLALEALEFDGFTPEDATHRSYHAKAIIALKQALEQPAQEPLAWMSKESKWRLKQGGNSKGAVPVHKNKTTISKIPLYTTPPQRTWVGLTPQERDEINEQVYGAVPHHVAFHAAIEAKLKELNT